MPAYNHRRDDFTKLSQRSIFIADFNPQAEYFLPTPACLQNMRMRQYNVDDAD